MYGSRNIILCVSTTTNLEMFSFHTFKKDIKNCRVKKAITKEEKKKLYNEILADQVVLYTRTDGEIT